MFNNLIESSSHAREFKRRGSFVLFTAVTYSLVFVIAGVMSIYAYDAHLEDQNNQIVTMLSPVDLSPAPTTVSKPGGAPPKGNNSQQNVAERAVRMARIDASVAPAQISATPNKNLPIPASGLYTITGVDRDPVGVGGGDRPGSGSGQAIGGGNLRAVEVGTPPPPVTIEKTVPKVISKGVINGDAITLPKPAYPPLAKQLRIQGTVSVQILIDEAGKVVSAKVVSGHQSLATAARQAALGARFSPTRLSNQPVKVSGVITYNFQLQ